MSDTPNAHRPTKTAADYNCELNRFCDALQRIRGCSSISTQIRDAAQQVAAAAFDRRMSQGEACSILLGSIEFLDCINWEKVYLRPSVGENVARLALSSIEAGLHPNSRARYGSGRYR